MKKRNAADALKAGTVTLAIAVVLFAAAAEGLARETSKKPERNGSPKAQQELSLDECVDLAMENSHRRPASNFAVAMAEAQHRQALAGYWPQVTLKGAYQQLDEPPNFIFPASSITTPLGRIPVPAQDIKLLDRESYIASGNATWLLYDGGMRKGLREQAKSGVDAAREDARRTDLEIVDSVKRLYYGAVLARQLHQIGKDTLARMEATLSLTETMYKEGSGKVMKTDYLDNKVMVESLRSAVALLDKNEEMAEAALANTMGMEWNTSVKPTDRELPFAPYTGNLEQLVGTAYEFSPDWARVEAGIRAAEGAVRTARSGHHPKLAVTGEVHRLWNDYDAGLATDENKKGWSIGVGIELPLFDGFLTRNKVREARARADKIKEERFLLQEGIGLQIKDIFLGLSAAQKSHQATLDAMNAAQENRDLNTRAYQNELVETEKVIRAQLVEALMSAQHYKTRYDHVALQSQLSLVVGTEVEKQMEKTQPTAMYLELEDSTSPSDKP
jgi:outer membrane protein TolC